MPATLPADLPERLGEDMSTQQIDYQAMAYTIADQARAHFTDESIARIVACGEKGLWTWAEVYDEICGAISRKERNDRLGL